MQQSLLSVGKKNFKSFLIWEKYIITFTCFFLEKIENWPLLSKEG